MDTTVHHIQTTRTARLYTAGNLNNETRHVWLVLHGYGQLAEYFIRHFSKVQLSHHFFIAPEALSRFYLNQTTGRIGATWMTKEDRENEIRDYIEYLDNVLASFTFPLHIQLHVLGFSQGAATACRWLFGTAYKPATLICWAGFFPPDMQWESPKYLDEKMKTYLVYGNQDEYINDSWRKEMEKVLSPLKKKPNIITFEGKHEIVDATLQQLIQTITHG